MFTGAKSSRKGLAHGNALTSTFPKTNHLFLTHPPQSVVSEQNQPGVRERAEAFLEGSLSWEVFLSHELTA